MIFLQLFWVFTHVGLFGFGGGYAVLTLIQHSVVDQYNWISSERFADLVAISQMTPGPININCATYIGYEAVLQAGYPIWAAIGGSLLASVSICLPSIALMTLVLKYLFSKNTPVWLNGALDGLKPVIIGLILSAAFLLMNRQNFVDYKSIIICVVAFVLVLFKKLNPIYIIILSGIAGYFLY